MCPGSAHGEDAVGLDRTPTIMKKMLVALDGSPRADAVLSYAQSLAQVTRAKLLLFRAFSIPPDLTLAWPLPDKPLEASLRRQAKEYLVELARSVPRELLGGIRVVLGVPWHAVCAEARDQNVDLIVIGSHGYGGLDHLLGTTAGKIVNHADRSVLVVRPSPADSRRKKR